MVQQVAENINFPQEEEKILNLWNTLDCFQECLKQSKNRPRFTFYDGPPFATGLPHYGHILAGTIKDVVTRFAHQSGFYVDRRFGWDCHGLPVEYEIDKTLGIKGPEDVAKMGIAEYNNQCRGIVMRYSTEWRISVTRLGRWIDFDKDYKTLYPEFMETVWWVFKQLYDKGLVYRGVKVMPFSTACNTPLSNFESHQNYKDVQDPSVIVSFPLDEDENVSLVAWTTTPWTLPSNLALCVNPELQYVKCKNNGAFTVVTDNYVKEEEGTGVVHQAPYFGADDYRVCMDFNIIQKDSVPVCPVDASGCFTAEVIDFAGQYVKDADKNIIKALKEQGRLVHTSTFKHNYPFCWRSDTPLIYKAVPSWFVRVEHMVEKLLENNGQCYWVPDFVREKRFGNWLKDARDWAISRNRYWGTPIPLWVSNDFEEVVCIGSVAELEELSGVKITDLHRERFYTLLVLSTALFGKPPFKNVIVNGLVLASDGQKMSKRKKNYPDPVNIVNGYGADALRLYLINSPVVRAENLRFKEEGVRDVLKDVFLPWYNAYRFLIQNIVILQHKEDGKEFLYNENTMKESNNIMDKWILSFTQSLIQFFKAEMAGRVKGLEGSPQEGIPKDDLIDKKIENAVSWMQSVIELGRVIRDRKTIPVKYPLKEVVVIHQDQEALENIRSLEKYILEELNVRQVTLSTDKDRYGIRLRAEPDHMVLGKRLKGAFKAVMTAIKELKSEQLEEFQTSGTIVVEGHELHEEDLRLMYTFDQVMGGSAQYEAHSDAQVLVLLDVTPDQSMVDEGVAREVINRIQKLRKKRNLVPTDEITVYYRSHPEGDYLDSVIKEHTDFIFATIKAALKPYPVPTSREVLIQEKTQLKGSELEITLVRGGLHHRVDPACAYVNLNICINGKEQDGVLLLENPKGDNKLNYTKLMDVVSCIFGLKDSELSVFNGKSELLSNTDLLSLSGKTLHVTSGSAPALINTHDTLLCQYINLQLVNAKPQECLKGVVGTLLMENPVGQNGLTYQGLLYETAKVFGLRSRRLKLFLDEAQTQGKLLNARVYCRFFCLCTLLFLFNSSNISF
ncbi:Isoleucyl-tRNA synthetase, cytoplasmic [Chelonia mydas]|uniref:isoleucine--tRNA ligase n=1 Tax=Chelonia mydas TaxID=8469 RepID=M7BV97_CHEMY|nr:Isoleucyl-tRNA synthetase, cytoplasmic [Chelonia mydas]